MSFTSFPLCRPEVESVIIRWVSGAASVFTFGSLDHEAFCYIPPFFGVIPIFARHVGGIERQGILEDAVGGLLDYFAPIES